MIDSWNDNERAIAERAVKSYRSQMDTITASLERGELTVYNANQNKDLTEGRGPVVPRGMFLSQELAEAANELLDGVMGTPNTCGVSRQKVYFDLPSWQADYRDHLRTRA